VKRLSVEVTMDQDAKDFAMLIIPPVIILILMAMIVRYL